MARNALLKREIILFVNDGRPACLELARRGLSGFIVVKERIGLRSALIDVRMNGRRRGT